MLQKWLQSWLLPAPQSQQIMLRGCCDITDVPDETTDPFLQSFFVEMNMNMKIVSPTHSLTTLKP